MTLSRLCLSFVNALFITAGLLLLMHSLVSNESPGLEFKKITNISWAPIPKDSEVEVIATKPKPPTLIDDRPKVEKPAADKDSGLIIGDIAEPPIAPPIVDISSVGDGQLSLAFAIEPAYPSTMERRGVEGYVVVGFSVSAAGAVFDPYIVEAEPSNGFNRAALTAIKKFKYIPRKLAGKPVATDGQFYKFVFELDQ